MQMPAANRRNQGRPKRFLPALARTLSAVVLSLTLAPGSTSAFESVNGPSPILAASQSRIAARLGPYTDARRWQIYTALDKEFQRLWDRGPGPLVARARTTTFRGFPDLRIEDRNRDGKGDFYGYHPASGGDTQEFGAFFDLANDGSPDWLEHHPFNLQHTRQP
jgi:hypothetical protein